MKGRKKKKGKKEGRKEQISQFWRLGNVQDQDASQLVSWSCKQFSSWFANSCLHPLFSPCLSLKCACGDLCLSHSSFSYKYTNPIIGASSFWPLLSLFSRWVLSDSLRPYGVQQPRPPCPSLCPGVCSDSCPLSWWCHPTISSSFTLLSSCPQSFPASGSFPVSQLFALGGQSIGASASVLPMNIQSCFPLGLIG